MIFSKIPILGYVVIGSVFDLISPRDNEGTFVGNRIHVEATKTEGFSIVGDIDNVYNVKSEIGIRSIPEGAHVPVANYIGYLEVER